jgi:hypothetical protein
MKSHTEHFTFEEIWNWLEGSAPFRAVYKHYDTGEDNGDGQRSNRLIVKVLGE